VIKVAEAPILEKSDHFTESQNSRWERFHRGFQDDKIDLSQKLFRSFQNEMFAELDIDFEDSAPEPTAGASGPLSRSQP
jgi:hypothetical protein